MTSRILVSLCLAFVLSAAAGAAAQTKPGQGPAAAPKPPADFQSLDTDGNGEITLDEFRKHRVRRFQGLDRDKDGWMTAEEFAPAPYGATRQPPVAGTMTPQRPGMLDPVFTAIDKNYDGRLSEDEFVNAGKDAFGAIDADKDGRITPSEWDRAPRVTRGKMLR